jgi:hypothetical protein
MSEENVMSISWFALLFLILVAVVIIKGLANPHSRSIVLGLMAIGIASVVFLSYVGVRHAGMTRFDQMRIAEETQMHIAQENERAAVTFTPPSPPGYPSVEVSPSPPAYSTAPPPPGYSPTRSTEASRQRKPNSSAAAAKMVAKADNSTKAVKSDAPDKSPKTAMPSKDDSSDTSPEPPSWVKADPKYQGDVYLMTRHTEPYSTELECEREVPKALQSAVTEYAQLLLGNDQGKDVHISDSEMRRLVRGRWFEPRPIEVDGETKNMLRLHLLIAFDKAMEQRVIGLADNVVVNQRLHGAGVVLGGLLGLLALVWAGLRIATK